MSDMSISPDTVYKLSSHEIASVRFHKQTSYGHNENLLFHTPVNSLHPDEDAQERLTNDVLQ